MSRRDPRLSLSQMRDHAREAIELLEGKTKRDLEADRVLALAIIRLLEVLGEAANRIPAARRDQVTEIPWRQIIGLRNRLIHAYDNVDLDIVWQIVSTDLPRVVREIDTILSPSRSQDQND